MESVAQYVGIAGSVLALVMWAVHTVRHRRHLDQCVADLQRQRRLDLRLVGCVTELEQILDSLPPSSSGSEMPEEVVGHARFLYGLRVEARDNASNLSRHASQLRWPDGYIGKVTLSGERCRIAHGALIQAFESLERATREYERGLAAALRGSGDGGAARSLTMPVRLLDESSAIEVARLREACERALTQAADACKLPVRSHIAFETKWPVRRSEVRLEKGDPYRGEVRPMSWSGFGAQPIVHVDAR